MLDLFFDPPWYLIVGLLLAGAVLLFNGLTRGNKSVRTAGLVAFGLAAAVFIAGRLVETDTEKVTRLTADVARFADKHDWTAFAKLLDPNVRFDRYAGRDELTKGVELTVEKVGVKNITTNGYDVKAEPGGYQVSFSAAADIDLTGQRTPTNWRFFWAKSDTPAGYLLYRIEPLPSIGFGTEPVTSRLVKP